MKKVSVIIPAYNCEKNIKKCVDSLISQLYKNIQIIIVNDGSTDNTLKICEKIKKKYSNIIVLNKKNEGPGVARNYGLKYADGEYISFIDSDDYVDKNFYLKLVSVLDSEKTDLVECGYKMVYEDGTLISNCHLKDSITISNLKCVEEYVKKINTTNFLWNKLYKKSLFDNVEFVKLYASEDACVLLQLFSNANRKVTISDCMYNYVQTSTSLCRKPYNLSKNDVIKAGKFMYDFCEEKYPEFSIYYSAYICSYAAQCYSNLKYSNIENKELYMKEMIDTFKMFYVKNVFYTLKISNLRKMIIFIFNFSPMIASYIYKGVLKK